MNLWLWKIYKGQALALVCDSVAFHVSSNAWRNKKPVKSTDELRMAVNLSSGDPGKDQNKIC